VEIGKLAIPGLHLAYRTEDDGGLVYSWADAQGDVRALVRIDVETDGAGARRFVDHQLHGIARVLPELKDASLADLAYADEGAATIVLGTIANVAFDVRTLPDPDPSKTVALPSALSIATSVRSLARVGAPTFPTPTVSIPPLIDAKMGAPIAVSGATSQKPTLRAEGAYVSAGTGGPVLRPFAPGPVTVTALVVDELGRVGIAKASAVAK
jgi:hypothetical protein